MIKNYIIPIDAFKYPYKQRLYYLNIVLYFLSVLILSLGVALSCEFILIVLSEKKSIIPLLYIPMIWRMSGVVLISFFISALILIHGIKSSKGNDDQRSIH